ncbi:MAG: outer membrane beta-barrel protein [Betaproteobacteria bacterium]|nr:outer membrane beta-barrel protein [Betaproteobacteria bacterium]
MHASSTAPRNRARFDRKILIQTALAAEPNAGFYGGLGVGRNYTDLDSGSIAGSKDEKDTAWKFFGGYQINRYIGIEGGYVDLGKASVTGVSGGNVAGKSDADLFTVNALYRF